MSDPADVLDMKDFLHHNNNVWCQTVFIRQCLRPSLLSLQCCCDTSSQSDWPSHFWAASEVSIWCFHQNSQIRNAELSASVYKYVPNMCDSGKEHLSNDVSPLFRRSRQVVSSWFRSLSGQQSWFLQHGFSDLTAGAGGQRQVQPLLCYVTTRWQLFLLTGS